MKKLLTLILPLTLFGCAMSDAAPAPRNIHVVKGESPKPSGKKYTYTESPATPLNLHVAIRRARAKRQETESEAAETLADGIGMLFQVWRSIVHDIERLEGALVAYWHETAYTVCLH